MYNHYKQTVLWDIDATKVDSLSKEFVTKRVLSYGTIGLIVMITKEHGFIFVKSIFLSMKPTSISERKYEYLKNYFFV